MFDGNFAGCENFHCIYAVPATFGSSGSAIYNQQGELISILVAAATNFENVSMGPHVYLIQTLVDTVQKEIDIY
jgi:V8-like Glu-specific endopeptidase